MKENDVLVQGFTEFFYFKNQAFSRDAGVRKKKSLPRIE